MINELMFAVFNAAAFGMAIFLVAAGLTLIFGLLRLLNMAQGGFFMIGAYTAYSVMGRDVQSLGMFLVGVLAGGVVVALLGLVTDRLVLRRLRNVDPHYVLIATFALMMVCTGVTKLIWGVDFFSVNPPPGLDQPLNPFGLFFSAYQLFVIGAGIVVYALLELAIHRLWFGKLMQALAADPWMSGLLGLNVSFGVAISVMVSFFLAGLAGGLLLPNQSLSTGLGDSYLMYAFFAVIIGGLGNIRGAFIGSLVLGLVQSLNTVLLPAVPGLAVYVVLAAFLLWKPSGLFPAVGMQSESGHASQAMGASHRPRLSHATWQVLGAVIVAVGSGLHVAALYIGHEAHVSATATVLAVAIPLTVFALSLFALYSLLVLAPDPFHGLLLVVTVAVLGLAVLLAAAGVSMAVCLVVLMLAPVVTVVGYETVGHRHLAAALDNLAAAGV